MRRELFFNHVKNRSFIDDVELQEEIRQYMSQKLASKDSVSIYSDLSESGKQFDKQILIEIFGYYLKSKIGEWDLEYLLNWIEMSGFEFQGDIHEKVIFIFSTPEINYPISKRNVMEALLFLKGEKEYPSYSGHYDINTYSSVIVDK